MEKKQFPQTLLTNTQKSGKNASSLANTHTSFERLWIKTSRFQFLKVENISVWDFRFDKSKFPIKKKKSRGRGSILTKNLFHLYFPINSPTLQEFEFIKVCLCEMKLYSVDSVI